MIPSLGLVGIEPYGLCECVPCDTKAEEEAYSSCESVAVGSVIGGYIAMLHHVCWWCVFVLCLVF